MRPFKDFVDVYGITRWLLTFLAYNLGPGRWPRVRGLPWLRSFLVIFGFFLFIFTPMILVVLLVLVLVCSYFFVTFPRLAFFIITILFVVFLLVALI